MSGVGRRGWPPGAQEFVAEPAAATGGWQSTGATAASRQRDLYPLPLLRVGSSTRGGSSLVVWRRAVRRRNVAVRANAVIDALNHLYFGSQVFSAPLPIDDL